MKVEIVAGGIFGVNADGTPGEVPIGTIFDVKEEPVAWAGRYRVVSGGKSNEGQVFAVGKKNGEIYQIVKGDDVLVAEVTKDESAAFNKMDDAAKATFIEEKTKA